MQMDKVGVKNGLFCIPSLARVSRGTWGEDLGPRLFVSFYSTLCVFLGHGRASVACSPMSIDLSNLGTRRKVRTWRDEYARIEEDLVSPFRRMSPIAMLVVVVISVVSLRANSHPAHFMNGGPLLLPFQSSAACAIYPNR